jgi:hypothetical protein
VAERDRSLFDPAGPGTVGRHLGRRRSAARSAVRRTRLRGWTCARMSAEPAGLHHSSAVRDHREVRRIRAGALRRRAQRLRRRSSPAPTPRSPAAPTSPPSHGASNGPTLPAIRSTRHSRNSRSAPPPASRIEADPASATLTTLASPAPTCKNKPRATAGASSRPLPNRFMRDRPMRGDQMVSRSRWRRHGLSARGRARHRPARARPARASRNRRSRFSSSQRHPMMTSKVSALCD